jgi:putative holliday junction resolvase
VNEYENRRILGLDYGTVRVGVAISDPSGSIATGLKTLRNDSTLMNRIADLVREHRIERIVVGLPVSLRGNDSRKTEEVRTFCRKLEEHVALPIVLQDERFSSKDALSTMIAMNTTRKQRRNKGRIDEMAAAIILQSFLDGRNKSKGELT